MYLSYTNSNSAVYPVVIAEKTETVNGTSITTVYWAQPILITQNKHSFTVINEWDGSLKIDDENGTILSTMVGAGRKNNENKFEGVLMGDVATGSDDDAIITPGLYGFHNGEQSFAFKIDGTAFLGKSGNGRIIFNGDSGTISSGNYDTTDKTGMQIDLDDGKINAYNFTLTGINGSGSNAGSYIELSSAPNKFLTMHYQDSEKEPDVSLDVLTINTNNYSLHSFDWISGAQGTEIDLENGRWLSYCNVNPNVGKGILLDADAGTYPFVVGGTGNVDNMYNTATFKIAWDGSLSIGTNFTADAEGKIIATGAELIDLLRMLNLTVQ